MAAQIYLVTKSGADAPSSTLINGIFAMIVNADDGSAASVTIAEAIATANAKGHPLHDGYFDTVEKLGPPTGGIMTTDEDALIFVNRGIVRDIA
jgi:hypothetical protein